MSTSISTAAASFSASAVVSQILSSFAKPVFFETRCFASPSTVKPPALRTPDSCSLCSGKTVKRTSCPDSVRSAAHTAPIARAVLPMTATFDIQLLLVELHVELAEKLPDHLVVRLQPPVELFRRPVRGVERLGGELRC